MNRREFLGASVAVLGSRALRAQGDRDGDHGVGPAGAGIVIDGLSPSALNDEYIAML